ncbi:MAG TPA: methyltransferase domain-containing protein [Thermoanaerobaculia bacterium]|nr:methyltransferase domain-containing protein [Thermoanaerobaculia bacterium]
MRPELLDILVCPSCHGALALIDAREAEHEVESGLLRCAACTRDYPIVRFIPRFVPQENYASSFGFQWNRFPRTQLDSYSGVPITRERFVASTNWSADAMAGALVLDVGCGSGRFAEVSLSMGARVVAVDYSSAIDAARANLNHFPNAYFVQADIYHLPFRPESFDFVYCLGVLQHTPDVKRAFLSLVPPLKHGGRIAVDLYPKTWMNLVWPKTWLRPITKRMRRDRLFALVERAVPVLLPVSRAVAKIPLAGRKLKHFVPVSNYAGVYPLNEQQLNEWAILDTFDLLSPAYDSPQNAATLRRWFDGAGLHDVEITRPGHLVGRGTR